MKKNFQTFVFIFIIFASAGASFISAQTDKRIEEIRDLYTQTNEAIAIAEKEAPYSEIYVVELSVNKTGNSYPAVGTYSNISRFYYTFGDREKDPYPNRLMKINVVTKRAAMITNSEFLFSAAGQLVFGFVKTDGEEARETRLYFSAGQLIKLLDGEREVNIKNRNAIETAAAFKRESARLVSLFNAALKEGI